MTETRFLQLTEHNDHEGETWHQWLQVDGNETELDKLRSLLVDADAAAEDDPEDFPYELGETEPESVVDILVRYAESGYSTSHSKVLGVFTCPDTLGEDGDDNLYKGGITSCFKQDAPSDTPTPAPEPATAETGSVTRWLLNNDDDSHWYLVPVDKKDEFEEWVYGEGGNQPEGVTSLGSHPNTVTFERPEHFGNEVTR
ncbi:MAG TPA: hypothetical protein VNO31_21975 [Umezawaea sp.]|nr:hypothetical protein [Umezawaea sp.]